jgi:hypothetical protein
VTRSDGGTLQSCRKIHQAYLVRLKTVATTGNVRHEQESELLPFYKMMLQELAKWRGDCTLGLVPDDEPERLGPQRISTEQNGQSVAEVEIAALEGRRLVLEDGPEICDSESSSDRGEELE